MPTLTNYHWSSVLDCVMHETDQNGATIATYTHEPGRFGPLITENRDSGWAGMSIDGWSDLGVNDWGNLPTSDPTEYCHHYDALGSTTMMTDDTGAVTDTFEYDAWGNVVARTGTTDTPYTWIGRWNYQFDSTNGGYYVRERAYESLVARWISVDPMVESNVYKYCDNDPVSSADPSGLEGFFQPACPNPLLGLECSRFATRFDTANFDDDPYLLRGLDLLKRIGFEDLSVKAHLEAKSCWENCDPCAGLTCTKKSITVGMTIEAKYQSGKFPFGGVEFVAGWYFRAGLSGDATILKNCFGGGATGCISITAELGLAAEARVNRFGQAGVRAGVHVACSLCANAGPGPNRAGPGYTITVRCCATARVRVWGSIGYWEVFRDWHSPPACIPRDQPAIIASL